MRFVALSLPVALLITLSAGQSKTTSRDFSITLERTACIGNCPDHEVSIYADGSVAYEGHYAVCVEGARNDTISPRTVQKVIRELRKEDFFNWEEKKEVCVDLPDVYITVDLDDRHKRVLEGCNEPGKVLKLADEIDKISGARRWVGKVR